MSKNNYKQELCHTLVPEKSRHIYQKKEEQLENWQLTLKSSEFSNETDACVSGEPAISIDGSEEAKCGSTIRFRVNIKPANTSEWSVNWQKTRTGATELISIRNKKYIRSNNRQLVINCVEKEDEGKYRAFLSRESNGKIYKIFSNCIYLLPQKERPCFDVWNITTEKGGININYKVLECSPNLNKIKWMKNGENLVLRNEKYVGGGLNDGFITISSPNKADRGTYSCTVTNAVGSVSKNVTLDIPNANIATDSEIVFGSKTIIKALVSSCPSICGMEWQKSIDGHDFTIINVGDPKHEGSSLDPKSPVLVITRTTFEDVQYYRLRVWNTIGEHFSNTLHLNVTGKPPIVSTYHKNYNDTRSVELFGIVSVNDRYPMVHEVYWTKNGEEINTQAEGWSYSNWGVKSPSLIIHNVNHQDAGFYRLTVTNAVGSDKSDIVLGVPHICIERRKHHNGSQRFTAKIKSIPEAYRVQWKVKRSEHEGFSLIDVNDPDYEGSSNSLHHPVLVVQKNALPKNQRFYIKVDNYIGSSIKEIFYTPIQYFYYKADEGFEHFHYVYKLMRNCKSRVDKLPFSKEHKNNFMSKDVVIEIGIVGNFHEGNLNLISGGAWKETISEEEQIWDVSPLLCFQNDLSLKSIFKIVRRVSTRHRIIIASDTICKEAKETADSIIIVGKNKKKIRETITTCLEEPFHQISKKWLENIINQDLTNLASEIIAEIKDIRKQLVFEKSNHTAAISIMQGGVPEFIIPNNVKDYLLRMPKVNCFGIWENSSLKVFVQKETDENEIRKELLNVNKDFFNNNNFCLEIVKGKRVQKKTLLQGDPLLSCKQNDSGLYNSGTLGGFVRTNENKMKIYALTCNHIFPEEKQLAYAKDSNGFWPMGICVFTTRENACDFAAIELKDSFLDVCDVTVRRDDNKKVNAKLYTKNLRNVGLVHKIGAATNVTSGRIISLEYYDKEMDSHCRENIFLVKGLNGPFSKEGDSGSLVFSRPNSVIQNSVNVLGMVFAQNIIIDYDDDANDDPHRISAAYNDAENISVCYRIHTGLELFKKSQGEGFDVKFQDDLSVTLLSEDSFDI